MDGMSSGLRSRSWIPRRNSNVKVQSTRLSWFSRGKGGPMGHPSVSTGVLVLRAMQRRRKGRNDASKTPLEDMVKPVYHAPVEEIEKPPIPDQKIGAVETEGSVSTDS